MWVVYLRILFFIPYFNHFLKKVVFVRPRVFNYLHTQNHEIKRESHTLSHIYNITRCIWICAVRLLSPPWISIFSDNHLNKHANAKNIFVCYLRVQMSSANRNNLYHYRPTTDYTLSFCCYKHEVFLETKAYLQKVNEEWPLSTSICLLFHLKQLAKDVKCLTWKYLKFILDNLPHS